MNWPCHQWQEVRRTVCPAVPGWKADNVSEDLLNRLAHGFTSVELRCALCGDLRNVTLLGNLKRRRESE